MSQQEHKRLSEIDEPATIVSENLRYSSVNEELLELHQREREELVGTKLDEHIVDCGLVTGKKIDECLKGDCCGGCETTCQISRNDGTILKLTGKLIQIETDSTQKVLIRLVDSEPVKTSGKKQPDSSTFDHIVPEELKRIVKNTRISIGQEEMSLNAALLDIAAGHNDLEQYKHGSLGLHKALDERLKEEEKHNPDSKTGDVLREAKKSAFGLYLRVQRGDEELHGKRDGTYSGYFE